MLNPAGNPQREKRDGHNMLLLNFGFKKSDILRIHVKSPKYRYVDEILLTILSAIIF